MRGVNHALEFLVRLVCVLPPFAIGNFMQPPSAAFLFGFN